MEFPTHVHLVIISATLAVIFMGWEMGKFAVYLWNKDGIGFLCSIALASILIIGGVQVCSEMRRQK
jgi:hypothetical protein